MAAAAMAEDKPVTRYQGVEKLSAGYRLLASMGWKEGEGLGANKQGIKEHVRVRKKQDAAGVGANERVEKLRDWAVGMVSFDRILAGLKEVKGRSLAVDDEEEEEEEAEPKADEKPKKNRAKEANKAAGKASKKRPQPSSSDDDSGDDRAASGAHATTSSPSSSSDGGADAGAALAGARRVKLATHVGRYHKRERAKTVKNYSSQDLAAILGAAPGSSVGVAAVTEEDLALAAVPQWPGARMAEIRARPAESSSEDEEEDGEGEAVPAPGTPVLGEEQPRPPSDVVEGKGKAKAKGDAAAAKPSKSRKQQRAEEAAVLAAADAAGPRRWWMSAFVRAGTMGSTRHELKSRAVAPAEGDKAKAAINVHGFSEADQTKLYEKVQNGATTGKQGLGRSSAPKKVAGAHWCGTKTKLGSDDEGSDEDDEGAEDEGAGGEGGSSSDSEGEDGNGIVIVAAKHAVPKQAEQQQPQQGQGKGKKAKKAKKEEAAGEGEGDAAEGQGQGREGQKVKWRKLVAQILADAPKRRLKIRQLRKRALSAAGLDAGGEGGDAAERRMLKKLRTSGRFETCDKYVRLV